MKTNKLIWQVPQNPALTPQKAKFDLEELKIHTHVPTEGLLSARQAKGSSGQEVVEWTHRDPVGLTERGGGSDGGYDALAMLQKLF